MTAPDSLKRIAEEMRKAICKSCGGTGWIHVAAERKKYECGDCISGLNISADIVTGWASRIEALRERVVEASESPMEREVFSDLRSIVSEDE